MADEGVSDDGPPSGGDTMRSRAGASTWKLKLLLETDRFLVSAGISAFVFLGVLAVGLAHPTPARTAIATGDPAETLFQGLVTTIVTGVTLVLTLNQLVLSQELGAVGDQRERMQGAMEFRADAASELDDPVSPPEPSAFLQSLVAQTGRDAEALRDAVPETADETVRDAVERLVENVIGDADRVGDRLADRRFGRFEVIFAALDYNYSWKLYAARRIEGEHGDALSDEAATALADLTETLRLFGPAREHFKTLYFQWELVDLSRAIMIAAVPALVVATAGILFFDASAFPGAVVGVDLALVQVAAVTAVAVTPFSILLAYVVRIATVTKRTLSIGPFILRETDRPTTGDWD